METFSGTSSSVLMKDKKKYKLLCIDDPTKYCGIFMGQGSAFCINVNCSTTHKSSDKVNLSSGQLCVIKSKENKRLLAFIEPTISSDGIDEDLIDSWMGELKTLQEWTKVFRLASSTLELNKVATEKSIMAENQRNNSNRDFKTPRKEKVEKMMDTSDPSQYRPFVLSSNSFTSEDDARNFMSHIEQNLQSLHSEVLKLNKNQRFLQDLLDKSVQNLDARVKDLEDEVGHKPTQLDWEFDSPNLWSGFGNIASFINGVKDSTADVMSSIEIKRVVDKSLAPIEEKMDKDVESVRDSIRSVKETLILVAKRLKQQASDNMDEIHLLRKSSLSSHSLPPATIELIKELTSDVNGLLTQMDEVNDKVSRIDSQGGCIKFHNLGFPSKFESDAWFEIHSPEGTFGLIVDFHTLMEHLYHAITGVDAMKQLQNVYKLKMKTISEALSVTSFEVPMPRFLTSSGSHVVIDNQESYFTHIKTYKDWHNPNSGFKLR